MSWTGTLRALAAPRRAIPLGIVLAALVIAEWAGSRSLPACGIDVGLFAAFCAVAPHAWRVASARASGPAGSVVSYGAFALAGAAVVAVAAMAPTWIGRRGTYVVDPPSVGLLLVLFLVGGWGLGRDIDLEEGKAAAERRADRSALETERARLVAMRAQLDPHFLFNTLNAIAEWCREDPALAERATLALAAMLRDILDGSTRPSWPLAREVALVEQLAALYAIRDAERFRFVVDVPDPVPAIDVPPMLFLPLVENAVTHGPAAGHVGEIRVTLRADAAGVSLAITNPGAFAGRREGGHGLAMVERRLALAYAGAASLSVRAAEARTIAELSMPVVPVVSEAVGS